MSKDYINDTIKNIRNLTPNYPGYNIKKGETYTQKQWKFKMKVSQNKENLRKKSVRLSTKDEEIVSSLSDLDKILEEQTELQYKKKWTRLGKRYKINRLMMYYGKSHEMILEVYDKIQSKDVEYDEGDGRIKKITVKDIFKK